MVRSLGVPGSRRDGAGSLDRRLALVAGLVPVLLLGACAGPSAQRVAGTHTLPDFATPRGRLLDTSTQLARDVIPYRQLTRDDFRGSEPPEHLASHRERVGAATCAYVVADPRTRIRVDLVVDDDGGSRFRASARKVGFRALMDRGCSWWNDDQELIPEPYVLEHEQIHFALFELAARRLDAEAPTIESSATATRASQEAAIRAVRERLQGELSAALQAALERNRRFDEDTSMGLRPDQQEKWLRRVRDELARTQP